jgi:seryl-tRNA synthetase
MADSDDAAQDKTQDTQDAGSDGGSAVNWEEKAKHFQSLADKRDADFKSLSEEHNKLKAAQEEARTADLKEKEEFKKLYEESEKKVAELTSTAQKLGLSVKLQEHVSREHPDYAQDLRWIAPLVTSEEDIASVTDDYVKAHPKVPGQGTASMGNTGAGGGGVIEIPGADMTDPVKLTALRKEHPDLDQKLERGEIKVI